MSREPKRLGVLGTVITVLVILAIIAVTGLFQPKITVTKL